MCRPAGVEVKL